MCVATNTWGETLTINAPQCIDASVATLLMSKARRIVIAVVKPDRSTSGRLFLAFSRIRSFGTVPSFPSVVNPSKQSGTRKLLPCFGGTVNVLSKFSLPQVLCPLRRLRKVTR